MLLMQTVRFAPSLAFCSAGKNIAARTAMIATTTRSSMSVKELSAGVWKGRRDEDEDKPIPHGRFGFVVMTGVQRSTVRRTFAPGEHALLDNKGTIKDVLCKRNILQALRSRGSLNAMSRRPVHRTLPPLAELQPRFRCFGSTQNASRSLVEI